jgi:hypothetical protein
MPEAEYEKWRREEYGRGCGSLYEANLMSLERAEAIIRRGEERSEE